jgi:hypothetical protein
MRGGIVVVVVMWVVLNLNPHPVKAQGAAPKSKSHSPLLVGWVESKSRDLGNDRGYKAVIAVLCQNAS